MSKQCWILSVIHILTVFRGCANGLNLELNDHVAVDETLTIRCSSEMSLSGIKSEDLYIFRELPYGDRYYLANGTKLCARCLERGKYIVTNDDSNGIAELVFSIERVNGGDSGRYGCSKKLGYKVMKDVVITGPVSSVVWEQNETANSSNLVKLKELDNVVLDLRNKGANFREIRCRAVSLAMPPRIDVIVGERELTDEKYTEKLDKLSHLDGVVESYEGISQLAFKSSMIDKREDDNKMVKCIATLDLEMMKFHTVHITVWYDAESFNVTNGYANVGHENITMGLSFYANPISTVQIMRGPNHTPLQDSHKLKIDIEALGHFRDITVKFRYIDEEDIGKYYLQVNDKFYDPGLRIGRCNDKFATCGCDKTVNNLLLASALFILLCLVREL